MSFKNKVFISAVFFIGISLNIAAANFYVNANSGNDAFNGKTVGTAKKTLAWFSWSTSFLKPGDTIFVMNGNYSERMRLQYWL